MEINKDTNRNSKGSFCWGLATDVGQIRSENQDAFYADPQLGLFIISDGMGGQQAGSLASKIVVNILAKMVENRLKNVEKLPIQSIRKQLQVCVNDLSSQLREQSAGQVGLAGMGATLVMALVLRTKVIITHLGDSRAYLFRNGNLKQLTEDHSVVGILFRSGKITREETKTHSARGVLSRFVGMEEHAYSDIRVLTIKKGDRLLLCTDGLTGMVTDEKISEILRENYPPQPACQTLVDTANAAGGEDNVTVLIVDWKGVNNGKEIP